MSKGTVLNKGNVTTEATVTIDPAAIMRIENLQLRAKVVVDGFYSGLHRSPLHGASVEFSEYRDYSPGDDPRSLDWKLFARSDRYFIKKFEEETNRHCHLIVDQSRSMGFGSIEYSKMEYARTMAATLAYFLTLQRDQVGLMTVNETITERIPPGNQTGHLRRLLAALAREVEGNTTNLLLPLEQVAALTSRRGMAILISDCLTEVDSISRGLQLLRSRGHEVAVLQVLDPAEQVFAMGEPTTVVDMESGTRMHIDPATASSDYHEAFSRHQQSLRDACEKCGSHFYQISTDEPLQEALSQFVQIHQRGGQVPARRGMQR